MATMRLKSNVPVGSAEWVSSEREVFKQFVNEEAEEFAFSAHNEVDWLNEHMAEIFNQNQLYVSWMFGGW